MDARPLVVVSNDDGIRARGLERLAEALSGRYELLVVAPCEERSASGHAVNMNAEWRVERLAPGWYSVDGSPADCVYLALCQLADRPVSLVCSGINRGFNLGTDVFYSGTVAAAAEATILGLPAISVSAEATASEDDLSRAARFALALSAQILREGFAPRNTLLNVNVPAEGSDLFSVGALGFRDYPRAPRIPGPIAQEGWIRLKRPRLQGTDGCTGRDADIVRRGHISVTPLRLDWTHPEEVDRLSGALRVDGFTAACDLDGARTP